MAPCTGRGFEVFQDHDIEQVGWRLKPRQYLTLTPIQVNMQLCLYITYQVMKVRYVTINPVLYYHVTFADIELLM